MAKQDVVIKLSVSGEAQVKGALLDVEQKLERLSGAIARAGHYGVGFLGLTQGVGPMARAMLGAADAVTTLQNQLKLATGSTHAAGQAYEALFEIAQRSRVSFTEMGGTFASISRAGQSLGLSQQRLLSVTESIGNAMTISGGSAEGMKAALLQLGQGIASGTLRGEELNSVMEQTPRLAKALADGLGVPTGKLREMGAAGQITAEQVIKALESQAAVLKGEVAGATLTVAQAFTQLQNASIKTAGDMDKATGASSTLASGLQGLSSMVQTVGQAFKENESAIQTGLGAVAGGAAALGAAALAANLGKVRLAVIGIQAALAANPAALALLGIGAAVGGFVAYNEAQEKTASGIRKTISALEDLNKAPSIYARDAEGIAKWQKASEARRAEISKLRVALAQLDGAGPESGAETARLARQSESAALAASGNARLAASYDDLRVRLSGFKGDHAKYQADLTAIQELQAKGLITDKQAAGMLTELAMKHGEAAKATGKAVKELGDEFVSEREAAKGWADAMGDFAKITSDVQAETNRLSKAQARLVEYLGSTAYENASDGMREMALEQAYAAIGAEQLAEATKALALVEADLAKTEQSLIDAAEKSAASVLTRLQGLQDEEAALVIAASQNISLAQAIEEVEIARLREQQAALMREGDRDGEVLAIQKEIDARKKLKDAIGSKESREAAAKSAKDAASEWQKTAEGIEQSLTDALMRGFESGKDFAKNMRDTIVNMFKTMVLRPVVSAVVNPVAGAITGSLGLSGAANAATPGIGNFLGGGGDILGSIGSGVFGSSAAYGAALGTTSIGAGSQAAMLAAQTGEFGLAGLAATSGAAGGAMASIGAALPYVGAALAVASLIASMDDSGTMHTGGLAQFSSAGGLKTSTQHGAFGMGFGGVDYGAKGTELASNLARSVVSMLDSTASAFGREAGFTAATAFADDTSKDGAWGSLLVKGLGQTLINWDDARTSRWAPKEFADGEDGAKQYAAAVAKDVRDLLVAQTPEWADTMLMALGDAPSIESLANVVTQINAAAAAMDSMGKASAAFAGMSEATTSALIASLGGAEAAVASLSGYYGSFYTETERTALATQQLTGQMAELGVSIPATRDGFRALVDAAIAAGDTDLAAGLLSLQDEFAALTPTIEAAATAVAQANDQALRNAAADRELVIDARRAAEQAEADAMAKRVTAYQDGSTQFDTLRQSLLLAGDAAGLLAATTERAFANPNGQYTAGGAQYANPIWREDTTAAQFNYAYGVMAARLRRDLSDDLSANALRVQNVGPALSKLSVGNMMSQYDTVTGPVYLGIRDAIVQAAGDASFAVRDAVDGAALVAAQTQVRGSYGASGPGLASVYAAMAQPQIIMDNARAYSDAVGKLNGAMRSGAISTEQFGRAMEALQQVIPNPGSAEDIAAAVQGAQYAIGRAGFDSIKFYFGELGKLSTELAAAAAEAVEPIATMSASIGRLNSFATAFGVSAQAAMSLPSASISGYGMSLESAAGTIGTSALISQAAAIASSVLTTADAAAAAKRLAQTTAFDDTSAVGLRNAGLLLDGIRQNDAQSFENAFIRITDSFAKGSLTGDQFTEVFADALTSFQGVDEETQALTASMESLRDAMGGFADQLLIDSQRTTLSAGQTLAEMQRQYAMAYTSAATGDAQATGQLQSLGTSLLDKGLYASQSDYNSAFGKVVGDAQRLEGIAINTISANANQQNEVVAELREMNTALNGRVESLEKNLTAALAVIARNTANTSKGIDQINVVGVTTVPA